MTPFPDLGPRFRIKNELGSGGFGRVYLAEVPPGILCAVKVLRDAPTSEQERILERRAVEHEVRLATGIRSPHVAQFREYGVTEDGAPFVVWEYCEGMTLADLIELNGKLTLDVAGSILLQVTEGLAAIHAMEILHRDVKPQNVMLIADQGRRFFVKILDFGTAIVAREEGLAGTITRRKMGMATTLYAPPEYCATFRIHPSYDVYSAGVMAYHMLAGYDAAKSLHYTRRFDHATGADAAPPLDRVVPELRAAKRFVAAIQAAIAVDAEARPTSITAWRHELEAGLAEAVRRRKKTGEETSYIHQEAALPPPRVRSVSRRAVLMIAATVGLVLVTLAWRQLVSPSLEPIESSGRHPKTGDWRGVRHPDSGLEFALFVPSDVPGLAEVVGDEPLYVSVDTVDAATATRVLGRSFDGDRFALADALAFCDESDVLLVGDLLRKRLGRVGGDILASAVARLAEEAGRQLGRTFDVRQEWWFSNEAAGRDLRPFRVVVEP